MIQRFLICAILHALMGWCSNGQTAESLDFNTHIRPILSDRCWTCHGPDENTRKAKLRLDTKEGALASDTIRPGAPGDSELFKRITSIDLDEKMPPPDSHLVLQEHEIGLIRQWIEEGARWEEHWAFKPLTEIAPPASAEEASPIDASSGPDCERREWNQIPRRPERN